MNKLNFGCGSIQPEGWTNMDKDPSFNAPLQHVWQPAQIDGGLFDIIVAHCSIQMNEFNELPTLFKDLHRALATNGVLRISLPDILKGFAAYKESYPQFFPNGEENLDIKFCAWLTMQGYSAHKGGIRHDQTEIWNYYEKKWGGRSGHEKYNRPFKNKPLDWWEK